MDALENLKDFNNNCVFIHDDVESSSGVDWDQHGTNPFLLGVDTCVVDDLRGFGENYVRFLKSIKVYPNNIIVAKHGTSPLSSRIIQDEKCFGLVSDVCCRKGGISVFYSDYSKGELSNKISMRCEKAIGLYPSQGAFKRLNDKIYIHKILKNAGIPTPFGIVCDTVDQLYNFFREVKSEYKEILIKKHHWDTRRVTSEQDINEIAPNLVYPLIAEVAYPIKFSPVSHNLIWKGHKQHLFLVMQNVIDWLHNGNYIPTGLPDNVTDKIISISLNVLNAISDFEGVIGIDFVVTPANEIYAVDVNPRFNSSTYPFFYLTRLGLDLSKIHAKYSFVQCDLPSLSSLLLESEFTPFSIDTLEGIIAYSPAFNPKTERVEKISYLCISKDKDLLQYYERKLKALLNSFSMKGVRR